jgi:tripartite ATP-independent transporter DctP family solute receptor
MTKIRKIMFSMLLMGLLVLSVFTCVPVMYAGNQQYVVKIAFTNGPEVKFGKETRENPNYVIMKTFKESVEKDTKGRMKVELYLNGILGDNSSYLEQMRTGTLESALTADGYISSFYRDIQVLSIPYCFKNITHFYSIMDGKFGKKLFNDIAQKTGFRVLGILGKGFQIFTNSKRVVKTADDMKGLKLRVPDGQLNLEMVKAFGATPTPVAWMELYTALQTGVVDGQDNCTQTMIAGSIQEVQKYGILDNHLMGIGLFVISESYLKSLPKDIRAVVFSAARKAQKAARVTSDQNDSLSLNYIKKCCAIYTPTSAEWNTFRKRSQAPCVKWLKANLDHPRWVDELLKLSKK